MGALPSAAAAGPRTVSRRGRRRQESGQSAAHRAGGSRRASGNDYPDRDRAACAVGADETGHVAGRAVKVSPSTAVTGPERLLSFSTSIMSGTLGAGVWPALLSR